MGKVMAVCISEKKGTVKQEVGQCRFIEDYGLEQDAHAGSGRQVSLLSYEKVEEFKRQYQEQRELSGMRYGYLYHCGTGGDFP